MKIDMSGTGVALVTPFSEDKSVDKKALKKLVLFQIESGTDMLFLCGTTGEAPTISADEQKFILEYVIDLAGGNIRVMMGAGSNNTAQSVKLVKQAEQIGAEGILSVAPYYNKPSQTGYKQHYFEIASATSLPIILYNVPGRTGGNMEVETMLDLCDKAENIYCIKEASGNFSQIMTLLRDAPNEVCVLSGDDNMCFPMMALGARGVISVAANFIPTIVKKLVDLCLNGQFDQARDIHNKYLKIFQYNFLESNPIPIKYLLSKRGLIKGEYRLPLVPPLKETKDKLDEEVTRLKIT